MDEVTKVHSVAGIYDFIVKVKVKEYGSVKNVVELIEYTKPNAVDVILGVETSGRKDERKVREFVKAAKVI
uniref:phosphoribosylanthranilate isomerase n=1 Tax=Geoglobus ahangari TaxID=113653 RepID=A0A7C4S5U1_9EURY